MSGNSSEVSQPPFREGAPRASDVEHTAICSGASFSIYVLRELIGAGRLANVYRAHDARLRREVAVKILNSRALAGADGPARFLHEARMAAAVRHPNVVSIFDVGVHDGSPYIVMELLEGEDLDMRLSVARALREPVLIDIARRLIGGLAAVHDAGVVHRDVKPSNVFLARAIDGSLEPKLLDFSISKQTRDNSRLTTNGRRRWAAMPLYTAPEVLLDGDATPHSDQYSLGVLLYECVTGVNPFRADTVRESLQLITSGQARRVREQPIRPSRRLAAIIEKAMHVYPEQRFADLHELADALARVSKRRMPWSWLERDGARVAAPSTQWRAKPRQAPLDRAAARERTLGWALGAGVLACSIAAPIWAWRSVHRQTASTPVSVASPLAPSEGQVHAVEQALPSATASSGPASSVPRGVQPQPALNAEAHTSIAPQPLGEPALEVAGSGASASFEAEPAGQAPPGSAALEGSASNGLDGVVSPAPDAGSSDGHDPVPSAAASSGRHERGTNGALIFD